MKSVYLAHPYDMRNSEMKKEIVKILSKRYTVMDPFASEPDGYYKTPSVNLAHEIINKDFNLLLSCDEYFGWFPKGVTSIGTAIEMMWAYMLEKPVSTMSHRPNPFLLVHSDKFYSSLDELETDTPTCMKLRSEKITHETKD